MTLRASQLRSSETGTLELALNRASGSLPVPGNSIRHLADGPDAFAAMHACIKQAKRTVHFENYIIRDDGVGQSFAAELIEAAGRGVRVRVLYDGLGSQGTSRSYWRALRAAGIEVRAFNPLRFLRPADWFTRDHRKYVAVDGYMAVVGGLCIGDEWVGDPRRRRRPWRDTAVEIFGPAVAPLESAFARVWNRTGTPLAPSDLAPVPGSHGNAPVRVMEGIPGRLRVYRTVELLAAGARERIWVTDAYMLPPQVMYASLISAARDGVDVRLLLPGRSDVPLVNVYARQGYRQLLRAGVRIWEWGGAMLHAKTVIVDSTWFKVGSSNLNVSSLLGNYEVDVLIEDRQITQDAVQQYRADLSRSVEIVLRPPRWAPARIATRMPQSVIGSTTSPEIRDHLPTVRERGRRAVVTLATVARAARRSLAGVTVFGLLGGGVLLLALPRQMAYLLAAICFWLAGSAGLHFLRGRAPRDD